MTAFRVALITLLTISSTIVPAVAHGVTGIFVKQYANQVEFFNLTDVNGQLAGYYQIVAINSSQPDGVARLTFTVSGTANGSRLLLNLQGSQSFAWTADLKSVGGFVLDTPLTSGQIKEIDFSPSSVAEVNQLVADLTQKGNTAKASADVLGAKTKSDADSRAELADAQTRLANDIGKYRPNVLSSISRAKANLAKVTEAQQSARTAEDEKQSVAAQKHVNAENAEQSAQSADDRQHASDLRFSASSADFEVSSAKFQLKSADSEVDSAAQGLASANAELVTIDARIKQLKGIISKDKIALHLP